jgi:hypothetical protein
MRQKTVVCGSRPVDLERRQDSAEHLERQKCFEVRRGHDVEPRCRCCLHEPATTTQTRNYDLKSVDVKPDRYTCVQCHRHKGGASLLKLQAPPTSAPTDQCSWSAWLLVDVVFDSIALELTTSCVQVAANL